MPGTDLNLELPALEHTMTEVVSKTATALSAIEDDLRDPVVTSELDMNADLSMEGNAITNVRGLVLGDGADATPDGTLAMVDDELTVYTAAGEVRITLDGALDASAIGGITGLGGTDAAVTYDSASDEFRFTESPGDYADLRAEDVILVGTTGTVRLHVHDDLVTDEEINVKSLPAAGISLLAYDASTGSLVDAATVTTTNAVPVTTLTATGNVTAADHRFTTDRNCYLTAVHGLSSGSSTADYYNLDVTGVFWSNAASADPGNARVIFPLPCDNDGQSRITSWTVYVNKASNGGVTLTAGLYQRTGYAGWTLVGPLVTSAANAPGDLSLASAAMTQLMGSGFAILVSSTAANSDKIFGALVTYDRP